jgi:hypothetical protein
MALQHSVLVVQVACIAPQQALPAPPHASEAAHAGLAGLHVLPRAIRQVFELVSQISPGQQSSFVTQNELGPGKLEQQRPETPHVSPPQHTPPAPHC